MTPEADQHSSPLEDVDAMFVMMEGRMGILEDLGNRAAQLANYSAHVAGAEVLGWLRGMQMPPRVSGNELKALLNPEI